MSVSMDAIKELREKTGAGMMDCKKALAETDGDFEKAVDVLRKKGLAAASKKATRTASQGVVGSYIHLGGKIGVLVEINCETDFVARTDDFQALVKDVAMHIAAASPLYVSREEVPADALEREKAVHADQLRQQNKPENMIEKILTGKVEKFYNDICLVDQIFVKDAEGKKKISDLIAEHVGKLGENIVIRRFARFQLGEKQ
ncbi:MAG: translation elongation factor Ts [Nitrospirae bacterium]|nr:translation elongation factor Ts [Nitrospirota bacterium]